MYRAILTLFIGGCYLLVVSCSQVEPTPQHQVDVHLIMGQSNSLGRAYASQLPAELQQPLEDCFIYNIQKNRFEPIHAGVNTQSGKGQFGPVVQAAQLLRNYKQQPVYFVVIGYGNTQLYDSGSGKEEDWHPDSKELTAKARATLDKARAALEAEGKAPVFKSLAWWQGEKDAQNAEKAKVYDANEAAFFAYMEQVPYLQNTRRVVYKLFPRPEVMPHVATVNAAKTRRAAADAKTVALVETKKYNLGPQDKLHATAKGQVQAGTDLFNAIKNL